ncbi:MAG: anthranilate synthase component I family protein [Bacteroidales bacterium]
MDPINLKASVLNLYADTLTPVGLYLRLRDAFPQGLLLECTDFSSRKDAYSYICLNPVAGIEVNDREIKEYSSDGPSVIKPLQRDEDVISATDSLTRAINIENMPEEKILPGLFGFTSYNAINLFDNVNIKKQDPACPFPLLKYDLYSVVIAINHFNNTMSICELDEYSSDRHTKKIVSLLANKNTTTFPFKITDSEVTNLEDSRFIDMVIQGKKHCARGDVFQIVLSRRFEQAFQGDEFSVYRALRSVNPSPYLFYFDYLGYKLFGSSPEAQLQINEGLATINPIAGTIPKTGDRISDEGLAKALLADPKENSEHSMLVDLARNDLSRHSKNVRVSTYKEVQAYSHVIHLVSTVTGNLNDNLNAYRVFADTFPAGTLSGAPKHRAVQLIDRIEPTSRGYYGGAIGYIGLKGSLNHAIMIRSFASYGGKLVFQAGAGIVMDSVPEKELEEVKSKLSALRKALHLAENIK